jgi:hypothetical protein
VTPDYSPIMGPTEVEGFLLDGGWGTYGFKATPIVGVTMAELVVNDRVPDLIAPFAVSRFWKRELVSEVRRRRLALVGTGSSTVKMVEVRGFEPLTPAVRRQCSTGLSYTPIPPTEDSNARFCPDAGGWRS